MCLPLTACDDDSSSSSAPAAATWCDDCAAPMVDEDTLSIFPCGHYFSQCCAVRIALAGAHRCPACADPESVLCLDHAAARVRGRLLAGIHLPPTLLIDDE